MSTVRALHRVEPLCREGDPGRGLAAPVHDPLWGLAQQRRYGELAGEDTGSPVQASLRVRTDRLDGWRPAGSGDLLPYDPDRQVLEAVVSGESAAPFLVPPDDIDPDHVLPDRPSDRLRDRVDAGRRLAALLPRTLVADLRRRFPLSPADSAPRLLRRAATAYPDGLAVAGVIADVAGGTDAALAQALGTTRQRAARDRDTLEEHATWVRTTYGGGPDSWVAERLERRFDLGSGEQVLLTAPAHTRAVVDAPDLDATAAVARLQVDPDSPWVRRIPTRLRFPGMPHDRFWEFEDALLALHRVDAATHDLARLALVEFSSTYGNDWFTFPVSLEHGSVATAPEVIVQDTFGEVERVGPADGPWTMFRPGGEAGPRLVVPSTTVSPLAGPVVEEVRFVRDENANLVWAVESVVTDEEGTTRDLVAEYAARVEESLPLPADADLLYRLMTEVPEHWVPFVPVHADASRRAVTLVQAVIPRPGTGGVPVSSAPRSTVLRELSGQPLPEEEVGSAGVTVRRRWYLARSADGGRHVWVGRSVGSGRGEGASGLAFDVALDVALDPALDPASPAGGQ